jgi:2-methylcitrate dehydratase PrpD
MAFQPLYDEERQIYRNCRWCRGRGCVSCKIEADKEYARQFPNGPQPILSVKLDDGEGMEKLAAILRPEGIDSAAEEAQQRAKAFLSRTAGVAEFCGATPEEAEQAISYRMLPEVIYDRLQNLAKPEKKPYTRASE